MRLLYARNADDAGRVSPRQPRSDASRSARRHFRQSLPLHRLPGHCRGGARRGEATARMRVIGRAVPRLEDEPLLKGEGRFIDDIRLPGMLHAAFVRSPHAHAGVRNIDKAPALALPGVHAVFTRADIVAYLATEFMVVGLPSASYKQDLNRPALAGDEVVHVGQAVAIVVAEDRYIAEDAAALVDIDYEPLPAASDCRAALEIGRAHV